MQKLFPVLLTLLCLFSSTKPSEIPIQFQNQYISGLLPDYNLCQIFRPVAGSSGTRYFQGARPVSNVSEHVRYIVIHKCRWSSRQKEFYQPYVNQAYECEDTDFVQVLQTCHEEVAFIWSKNGGNDDFPNGFGLPLDNSFLMMMVIYEGLNDSINQVQDGLILNYNDELRLKPVHRLLVGHQASGKHVILSNQRDWITDGYCSGHCTLDYNIDTTNENPSSVQIMGFEVHTRSLGTVAHIDVQYEGTKYDTPLLAPTSFDSSNSIKRVSQSLTESYSLHPGDDLILRCHHSTLGKVLPIFGGVATQDELCFAVLTHHCPDRQYCPMNTLTSCMSRPTDENIAKALQFSLNYYETNYYEEVSKPISNKSSSIRFKDEPQQLSTRLKPPLIRRRKRQSRTSQGTDLFLNGPTIQGNSVLSAIDNFDAKASVPEKTSANFAILRGYHISECSDSYGAISSALIRKPDIERKSANLQVRAINANYHQGNNNQNNIVVNNITIGLVTIMMLICFY